MNPPAVDPDRDLVRACQNPNDDEFEAAFETLYARYHDRVYSIAYRMMGTTTDALDATQEAFAIVFRKIATFRFDSKFSTWVFRLVVNCCVDAKRRESSRTPAHLASVDEIAETEASDQNPAAAAETDELGSHVHHSLQRLSPKLRAVLVLRYLEGLTYDELAASLGVSLGTVKSRLARAHLAFEGILEGTLEPFDYPLDPRFRRTSKSNQEGVA